MIRRAHLPTVALIGRANVGKSTLFNRFVERSQALVSDIAGTTRDRKEGECLWRGQVIRVVDTGGLDVVHATDVERQVVRQAELAMEQADIILFVVDLSSGVLPQDQELGARLTRSKKPVIVVGNKAESLSTATVVHERGWRLSGLDAPLPVSALRGTGVGDLLDKIYDELLRLKKSPADITQVQACRVAVIGQPNVGKSSLLNAILGEERFITSPVAHTTREPNDVLVEMDDKSYLLIDTAGLRRVGKARKAGGLESAGMERTRRTLSHTDIALFVLDVTQPLSAQDRALAGLLDEAKVGIIVVANKWDLVPNKNPSSVNEFADYIAGSIPFLQWAPIVFVSALKKQRVQDLFPIIDGVQRRRYTEIPEAELEKFWRSAVRSHRPSKGKGPMTPKVLGLKQVDVAPPRLQLFIKSKRLDVLHASYLRYLENRLRAKFDLEGTPVIINVKGVVSV